MAAEIVLEIAIPVTRALIAAADRGLVHRDLKPGNIMLARHENATALEVKVIDFGLAKAVRAAGEMELTHGNFVGTPAFASPEQFAHTAIDGRTDIYALGVTMWFALTGRLPFAGTSISEIRERQSAGRLPAEQLKARAVPQGVIDLLRSCLAFDSEKRPASARELLGALEECRTHIGRRSRKRKLSLGICATALLTITIGAWLVAHRAPTRTEAGNDALSDAAVPTSGTENREAYLLFLRARAAPNAAAFELYERALALDPNFALARARLSITACELGHETEDAELYAKARREAEEALRLQPNLGEAYLALSNYYVYHNDSIRAMAQLNRAAVLLPRSAEVQLMAAWVYKTENKFRERIAALRRAEAIDPRYGAVRSTLVLTYSWVRDWKQSIDAMDRLRVVSEQSGQLPESVLRWWRASAEFRLTGDIDVLKQAVKTPANQLAIKPGQLNYERFEIAMFERDYARAAELFGEIPEEDLEGGFTVFLISHGKSFHEALLASASGADANEQRERTARAEIALHPALHSRGYDSARALADLAIVHAFAGRKEEAIREAIHASETMPVPPGSIEQNSISSAVALVYARTGEAEKAIDLIEHLLTVPCEMHNGVVYNMTLTDLKWRWVWDPLRSHPRFQKLLTGPEPRTIY